MRSGFLKPKRAIVSSSCHILWGSSDPLRSEGEYSFNLIIKLSWLLIHYLIQSFSFDEFTFALHYSLFAVDFFEGFDFLDYFVEIELRVVKLVNFHFIELVNIEVKSLSNVCMQNSLLLLILLVS